MSALRLFAHAVVDAIDGIYQTLIEQSNFRIQIVLTLLVVAGAIVLHFDLVKWAVIALACGAVLTAELFNTGLEHGIDLFQPGNHPLARSAKHAGAGAVLMIAVAAGAAVTLAYCAALLGK
jgi:undecaprenol kinase